MTRRFSTSIFADDGFFRRRFFIVRGKFLRSIFGTNAQFLLSSFSRTTPAIFDSVKFLLFFALKVFHCAIFAAFFNSHLFICAFSIFESFLYFFNF